VLIATYRRVEVLERCLRALAVQTVTPAEVIVAWQADDTPTRDLAERMARELPLNILAVHAEEPGVVLAENAALERSTGEIVILIDDDSVAPPDWIARHLAYYADPTVGAVGGSADCYDPRGVKNPPCEAEPIGRVTWYGRMIGHLHNHPHSWRDRPPRDVDHLAGSNMSLRRSAFDRFESGLRRYWQCFEADACLQVKARGYRVVFDPGIVVEHRVPYTDSVYSPGREGDLAVKVGNAAYNQALVLSKHTPGLLRPLRALYLLAVGNSSTPGPLLLPVTIRRHGRPLRELAVVGMTWRAVLEGWRAGRARRAAARGG
jgi:cellulose synthase/poly-beta-1,6-N-acetylglucosamine synthase-like glycosyltransferase